jgi:tetratricopeptide (TPR) repeat protein
MVVSGKVTLEKLLSASRGKNINEKMRYIGTEMDTWENPWYKSDGWLGHSTTARVLRWAGDKLRLVSGKERERVRAYNELLPVLKTELFPSLAKLEKKKKEKLSPEQVCDRYFKVGRTSWYPKAVFKHLFRQPDSYKELRKGMKKRTVEGNVDFIMDAAARKILPPKRSEMYVTNTEFEAILASSESDRETLLMFGSKAGFLKGNKRLDGEGKKHYFKQLVLEDQRHLGENSVTYMQALARIDTGDLNGAELDLARCVTQNPSNIGAKVAQVDLFYKRRKDNAVRGVVMDACEDPSNGDSYRRDVLLNYLDGKIVNNYGGGVASVKNGSFANGRKQLRRVVTLQSGEVTEATVEHTRALKAQYWIAESYLREGKQRDARIAFRKLLSLPEVSGSEYNHAQVHYKLGLSLLADKKMGPAKTAFRAAVRLDPAHEAKNYL